MSKLMEAAVVSLRAYFLCLDGQKGERMVHNNGPTELMEGGFL